MLMTNKECWEFISELNWGKDCDYKRIQDILFNERRSPQRIFVERFVRNRANDLHKTVKIFETSHRELTIGDDSLSDVIYHIIGLGENWYKLSFFNPETIEIRCSKGNYKESFAYCFQKPITERVMYNGNNSNELVIL